MKEAAPVCKLSGSLTELYNEESEISLLSLFRQARAR